MEFSKKKVQFKISSTENAPAAATKNYPHTNHSGDKATEQQARDDAEWLARGVKTDQEKFEADQKSLGLSARGQTPGGQHGSGASHHQGGPKMSSRDRPAPARSALKGRK